MSILRKIFVGRPDTSRGLKSSLGIFLLLFGAIVFWELLVHALLLEDMTWRILYVVGFSAFFALALTVLTGMLPRGGNLAVFWVSMSVLYLWYPTPNGVGRFQHPIYHGLKRGGILLK